MYPSNVGRAGDAAIGRVVELEERPQSPGEEIANSVSHGIGLLAALAAFPVLVVSSVGRGETQGIVGAVVFATTAVLLYLTSTLFHALPECRGKRVCEYPRFAESANGYCDCNVVLYWLRLDSDVRQERRR